MTTPAPSDPTRTEDIVRAVVTAVVEVLRAFRDEVQHMRRLAATTLQAAQRALVATLLALVFAAAAVVVLAVFLVGVLNAYLGEPWGTGVAALSLGMLALLFWMRARAAFRDMAG